MHTLSRKTLGSEPRLSAGSPYTSTNACAAIGTITAVTKHWSRYSKPIVDRSAGARA